MGLQGFHLRGGEQWNFRAFQVIGMELLPEMAFTVGRPITPQGFKLMMDTFKQQLPQFYNNNPNLRSWCQEAFLTIIFNPNSGDYSFALARGNVMWQPRVGENAGRLTEVVLQDQLLQPQEPRRQFERPLPLNSFAVEHMTPVDRRAMATNLGRVFSLDESLSLDLALVSDRTESAGALLVRKDHGVLAAEGIRVFETEATVDSVIVPEESYRRLEQAFVPFHTHLGYPHSFKGVARFAPTAEDVLAHQYLMQAHQKTHGTDLSLPGVIFHASGEVTIFYLMGSGAGRVQVTVLYPDGREETVQVSREVLEKAALTGELRVEKTEGNLTTVFDPVTGTVFVRREPMDLWDRQGLRT
ncbi:MAG: hypothetical protein LHV69_09695, partial [Elusimicrobia bacterium]|nr:hypothetical protein [Candidatus Obscuribacterium magneticum]